MDIDYNIDYCLERYVIMWFYSFLGNIWKLEKII